MYSFADFQLSTHYINNGSMTLMAEPHQLTLVHFTSSTSSLPIERTQCSLPLHILVLGDDIYKTLPILPFCFMQSPQLVGFFSAACQTLDCQPNIIFS